MEKTRPIVFIHGLGSGAFEYIPMISFLKKRGFKKFYRFTYKSKFGQVSLNDICREFAVFIKNNVTEKEFDIVGISQGGIIARLYIENYKDRKIKKCITLCSPHNGTLMAYLTRLPGFLELRPESKLLKNLEKIGNKNVKYYCVYNPFDIVVFPGKSAILKSAEKNKKVSAPFHNLTFWTKSTLQFILQSLKERR